MGNLSHIVVSKSSLENTRNPFSTKLTIMGSYKVGIWHAWCCQKGCEICSSLVQKKKLKKIHFASYMLPKEQTTNIWSQGILGVDTTSILF
jgi:hypothetical protein